MCGSRATDGVQLSKSSASLLVARVTGCKQHSILNEQQFRGRLLLDRAKGSHCHQLRGTCRS